jgi:hypothetical protein
MRTSWCEYRPRHTETVRNRIARAAVTMGWGARLPRGSGDAAARCKTPYTDPIRARIVVVSRLMQVMLPDGHQPVMIDQQPGLPR